MPNPLLLDVKSAATELGISRAQMYRLLNDGSVASGHIGRRRLVARSEIERFAEEVTGQ
jgi:excisionase family DNA binding protein